MKLFGRITALLLLSAICLSGLTGCLGGGANEFTVLLSGNHFTVEGGKSKTVEEGESAIFKITPDAGYLLTFTEGEYDAATGTLTVENVREDKMITVSAVADSRPRHSVTVATGAHYTVEGSAALSVISGDDAVFTVRAEEGYALAFSHGHYDEATGRLTVEAVVADTAITVSATPIAEAVFTVKIKPGDGFFLIGEAEKQVGYGEDAVFRFTVADDCKLVAVLFEGRELSYEFNAVTRYLTVKDVRQNMELTITVGSDKKYSFNVVDGEAVGIAAGQKHPDGTVIRVKALSNKGSFLGWTLGKSLAAGGEIVSTELIYELVLRANTKVYGNYLDPNAPYSIRYHMNGGSSPQGDVYVQQMTTTYFTSPNSMWDNGTFTRPGYVLLEYNTRADGSGAAYGLGSKIELDGEGGLSAELFCIWAPASAESLFTTKSVSGGVAITGYSGNEATVVIPEKIGGQKVVAISAGAIRDKSMTTLVISRNVKSIADGAVTGCPALKTLYFSDSVTSITDNAFDAATYQNWTDFYINATTAPRFTNGYDGGYRVKWDRLMAGKGGDMIVFVSGSSSLHGVGTEYLEALLDGEYTVVNYGTVRTTNNLIYMEAIASFVDEGDIVVYAPENSIWQFGCTELNFKTFRDLEACLNVFRYIDISNYSKVFSAYADYQSARKSRPEQDYEVYPLGFDENGDLQHPDREGYCMTTNYRGKFTVTLNDQVKSTKENLGNRYDNNWIAIDTYASFVRQILGDVKATGAEVYFGFCSVNENALSANARTAAQQKAFDALITSRFGLEVLGSSSDHIYNWKYMYDGGDGSDFHLNDYGRQINTYRFYREICEKLGVSPKGAKDVGTSFPGCKFE